jgi:hypothetical protein
MKTLNEEQDVTPAGGLDMHSPLNIRNFSPGDPNSPFLSHKYKPTLSPKPDQY